MQAVARQDGRLNISRLSVATGMTRKEVSALVSDSQKKKGAIYKRRGGQRALRVLRGWLVDPRFQNGKGRPDELRYRGGKRSFTLLVKLYGGDVTPKSVLRELERMEIVDVTRTGALRLRQSRSRARTEVHYKISDLARLFEDFAFAATQPNPRAEAPSFFGFRDATVSSAGDAANFMRRFSRRAGALLEDFEQRLAGRGPMKPASHQEHEPTRVGVGIYLLRSERPSVPRSTRRAASPTQMPSTSKPRG